MIPIINSLIDTDMSRFLLQNAILNLYPDVYTSYSLFHSIPGIQQSDISFIEDQIHLLSSLRITDEELEFIDKSSPNFSDAYLVFLKNYSYTDRNINIGLDFDTLNVDISGRWCDICMWEVPLSIIINKMLYNKMDRKDQSDLILSNLSFIKNESIHFIEKGLPVYDNITRRRYDSFLQDFFLLSINEAPSFLGTTNPYFAMKYNINLISNICSEWLKYHQILYTYEDSYIEAINNWKKNYNNSIIISPTDNLATKQFLKVHFFDEIEGFYSKHPDAIKYINEIVEYTSLNKIPIRNKSILFSDNISIDTANKVVDYVSNFSEDNQAKLCFQIGSQIIYNIIDEGITSNYPMLNLRYINGVAL